MNHFSGRTDSRTAARAAINSIVTFFGPEQPGITSEITGILSQFPAQIRDAAQFVIHGLLTLSFEIEVDSARTHHQILKLLRLQAKRLGLSLDLQILGGFTPPSRVKKNRISTSSRKSDTLEHFAITLIADHLTPQCLHEVSAVLAQKKINIDAFRNLTGSEFRCLEMLVSFQGHLDTPALRKKLLSVAQRLQIDIGIQAENLYRRSKRLVVFDMDSTLIQEEVIDSLAKAKGVYPEVAHITSLAMNGKISFKESLRQRCKMLRGLSSDDLDRVYRQITLTPGAQDFIHVLKKLGYKTALISGGFSFVANPIQKRLGIDFSFSNHLEISNKKLTGRVIPPVIDARRKAELLTKIAKLEKIDLEQVIAIGDGANDLLMLEKAGLGIAFNAKPLVCKKADFSIRQKNMRSILHLLGLSSKEILATLP